MFPFFLPNFRYNFRQKNNSNPYPPKSSPISNNGLKENFDNYTKNDNFLNKTTKNSENESDFLSNLLGIKLESDDLIILCLLFFLYKEKVDDTYLFIVLILLLLS